MENWDFELHTSYAIPIHIHILGIEVLCVYMFVIKRMLTLSYEIKHKEKRDIWDEE